MYRFFLLLTVCALCLCQGASAQTSAKSLAERLGYKASDKLLIIHVTMLACAIRSIARRHRPWKKAL